MTTGEFRTGCVVLAAGFSSRMGRCKALLELAGSSALSRVISTMRLAGIEDIVAVSGFRREEVEREAENCGVRVVFNDRFEEGMFSSVKAGIAALSGNLDAFFLLPVDIPMVRPATCVALKKALLNDPCSAAVIPSFRGRNGHPPLINAGLIPEILQWSGQGGLRALLSRHHGNSRILPTPDQGTVVEMNTPEEYEKMRSFAAHGGTPSREECLAFMELADTPESVQQHSETVAKVVAMLAGQLKDRIPLDLASLRAAALLHDMSRTEPGHAEKGASILETWGFPETADLVRYHMDLPEEEPLLSGRSLLYLADKLTAGDRVVDIRQKRELVAEKFSDDPEALEASLHRIQRAESISNALDKLAKEGHQGISDPFPNY